MISMLNDSVLQASDKWQGVSSRGSPSKAGSEPVVHASWVLQMPASHLLSVLSLLSWAHRVYFVGSYKRDSKGGGVAFKCLERKLQSSCDEHPVCPCSQRAWWLDPALLQGLKNLSADLESRAIFAFCCWSRAGGCRLWSVCTLPPGSLCSPAGVRITLFLSKKVISQESG